MFRWSAEVEEVEEGEEEGGRGGGGRRGGRSFCPAVDTAEGEGEEGKGEVSPPLPSTAPLLVVLDWTRTGTELWVTTMGEGRGEVDVEVEVVVE